MDLLPIVARYDVHRIFNAHASDGWLDEHAISGL